MNEGHGTGRKLVGIFVILFGLCVTLVGGVCSWMWIVELARSGGMNGVNGFFLLSLAVLAAGLLALWVGVKMLRDTPPRP